MKSNVSVPGPQRSKGLFGSAEFREQDAKARSQFLHIARAVGQAAGGKRAGKWPVPAFLVKVCEKPKPSLTELC